MDTFFDNVFEYQVVTLVALSSCTHGSLAIVGG